MKCPVSRREQKSRAKLLPYSEPPNYPPVICVKVSLFVPGLELKPNLRGSGDEYPPPDSLMSVFDGRRGSRQRNGIKALRRGNQTPGMSGYRSGPV